MASETVPGLRSRIKSVKNTQKIARAMFLSASAKYKRAYKYMENSRTFRREAQRILNILSPHIESTGEGRCCIVIAGDRGMSGGYNARILKSLPALRDRYSCFLPIGYKLAGAFRGIDAELLCKNIPSSEKITLAELHQYTQAISEMLLSGRLGAADILYTSFSGEVKVEEIISNSGQIRKDDTIIFEPGAEEIMVHTLADMLAGAVYACICEANACEQLSRRIAMDAAQTNAQEMLEDMHLRLNRIRRAGVTQELIEAVSGYGTQTGGE